MLTKDEWLIIGRNIETFKDFHSFSLICRQAHRASNTLQQEFLRKNLVVAKTFKSIQCYLKHGKEFLHGPQAFSQQSGVWALKCFKVGICVSENVTIVNGTWNEINQMWEEKLDHFFDL